MHEAKQTTAIGEPRLYIEHVAVATQEHREPLALVTGAVCMHVCVCDYPLLFLIICFTPFCSQIFRRADKDGEFFLCLGGLVCAAWGNPASTDNTRTLLGRMNSNLI